MTDKSDFPERCPSCGIVLLSGAIFDAAANKKEFGPILGIHQDVDPEQAKAGYVGIGSVWCYGQSPELYSCPRCKVDPMSKKPDGLIR